MEEVKTEEVVAETPVEAPVEPTEASPEAPAAE